MKDIIIRKSKTIQEKDPEEFDRKFNKSSEKLTNIVEIKIGFCAYVRSPDL